jgi:peptidoglycan/xylan/chitin deacetylase (PgdA/CDA1 family)
VSASPGPPTHSRAYRAARGMYVGARSLVERPTAWEGVRILGYHRISDDHDELAVTPARFREQMQVLRGSELTLTRLASLGSLAALPAGVRHVCVTFDDGYRDNLEHAVPVLDELAIPATIFLPTRIIDGATPLHWYRSPPPALSWDDVHDLQRAGRVDFQSHTLTHPLLPELDDGSARREIVDSRSELERRLGRTVTVFCYPVGRFGPRETALVGEAGYRFGVTTLPGVNGRGQAPRELRRTMIGREDDRGRFAAKLAGARDTRDPLPAALRRVRLLPRAG